LGSQVPNRLSLPLTINLLQRPWLWKKLRDTPHKPLFIYKYRLTYRLRCPKLCGLAVWTSGVNAAPEAGLCAFYSDTFWALKEGRDISTTGIRA